ncbi:MAG: DNA alkylation repair protein [Candidatus Choladocola sp.]|nr:DNA alkylation repair protein [Candidatus Choladocola sp.]
MRREEVLDLLMEASEPEYKAFNDRITNCTTAESIGVRMPGIRRIAGMIVKQGWEEFLDEMESLWKTGIAPSGLYQEEHMLHGIVIGGARMSEADRVRRLNGWIPGILSWADCDSSVSGFKFMKKNQEFWYDYNVKWLKSRSEFELRYAIVSLMQYFVNDTYIDRVLEIFASSLTENGEAGSDKEKLSAGSYYVRMAQAWAISVCFIKYRDKTEKLLKEQRMDPWIQNKAIQKCRESYRVSKEDKTLLQTLKMEHGTQRRQDTV